MKLLWDYREDSRVRTFGLQTRFGSLLVLRVDHGAARAVNPGVHRAVNLVLAGRVREQRSARGRRYHYTLDTFATDGDSTLESAGRSWLLSARAA